MSVRAPIEPPPIGHEPTLHEEDWTWWVECSCGWSSPVRKLWWPPSLLEHRMHVEEAADGTS